MRVFMADVFEGPPEFTDLESREDVVCRAMRAGATTL
jgi:hypothetical protein